MVTAGKGMSLMEVTFELSVIITGLADHLSHTFDMKYAEHKNTNTKAIRKKPLNIFRKDKSSLDLDF